MKKLKLFIIMFIAFITVIIFQNKSFAGLQVISTEYKDKITENLAFVYCYNLRVSNSTLGENKLDPHLMLNSDMAAAGYLGLSSYGGGSLVTGSTGLSKIFAEGFINGNESGVYSYKSGAIERTAAYREDYDTNGQYVKNFNILFDYADTKYVEKLPADMSDVRNKGRAFYELGYTATYASVKYPLIGRVGMLGYSVSNDAGGGYATNRGTRFRPVIWN